MCIYDRYISKTDIPIYTKIDMLMSCNQEEISERSELLQCCELRVSVRLVSVAGKLSTIEERRQDQSCLYLNGDYRKISITLKIRFVFESR
jgi:hypothetical protein